MRDPPEGFYKRLNGSLQKSLYTLWDSIYCLGRSASLYNDEGRASAFLTFLFVAKNKTGFKKYIFYFLLFLSSFFYFFSVFWILPKFRYIYFMKSKERAGEWISFCVTSSIPLVFCWGGRATFYLFGVAEANEVLAECYSGVQPQRRLIACKWKRFRMDSL